MTARIRPFQPDDYDRAFTLWQNSDGVGLSSADSRENILAYLLRNKGTSFVAEEEQRIIATILGGHDGRRGYIHHLCVHDGYRRQGLGNMLVTHCLDALKALGIQKCHIFILNDNHTGLAFWKQIGWHHRNDISLVSRTLEA
ncbi:MAG: GNAT family N-acetyltransferase [Desulfobacteraceae bacterium]|nr:MAG: GNAT family N-acetyltransferase [Desulfobacteraceae bacterium]